MATYNENPCLMRRGCGRLLRQMINGNTTNLNDFNHMKYTWASDWYRQAMNNFWIPEEINLIRRAGLRKLTKAERTHMIKFCPF